MRKLAWMVIVVAVGCGKGDKAKEAPAQEPFEGPLTVGDRETGATPTASAATAPPKTSRTSETATMVVDRPISVARTSS